jgi:homopolymeric O-antigen transport system ATP-binding protein
LQTSSDLAVVATNLGKRYWLGESIRHDVARDWLADTTTRLLGRRRRGPVRSSPSELWALRAVEFEIHRGDVVGVIGRNGAGKSTLLKILTGVTRPTTGSLTGWGRVGSLLELGTGFHPELTGRENIFLCGAVLGMRRAEIVRKFDRIVEFSGIEHMLDTPVKRYSSGMYVRLGFSVAAHLEPDILVLDEVLAVGDAPFQGKCLELVRRLAQEGTTVLLVSHNLGTVTSFCRSGLLLEEGKLAAQGTVEDVVRAYIHSLELAAERAPLEERSDRSGEGRVRLNSVSIQAPGHPSGEIATGEPLSFIFAVSSRIPGLECAFSIYDAFGNLVADFTSTQSSPLDVVLDLQNASVPDVVVCELDELLLLPGRYRIDVGLYLFGDLQDHVEGAAFFTVGPGAIRGRPVRGEETFGIVQIPHVWKFGKGSVRRSGAQVS